MANGSLASARVVCDRRRYAAHVFQVALFEVVDFNAELSREHRLSVEIIGVGRQHLCRRTLAILLAHVARVKIGLAIRHLPIEARLRAHEAEIDRFEIEELILRHALGQ